MNYNKNNIKNIFDKPRLSLDNIDDREPYKLNNNLKTPMNYREKMSINQQDIALQNLKQKMKNKDTSRHRLLSKERMRTNGQNVINNKKDDIENKENNYNYRTKNNINSINQFSNNNININTRYDQFNQRININNNTNNNNKNTILNPNTKNKINDLEQIKPSKGNTYNITQDDNNDEDSSDLQLIKCSDCNRKFNSKAFEKHSKICKKVFVEKTKVFDSSKQRQISESINVTKKDSPKIEDKPLRKIPKWKLQSEQFRKAMKSCKDQTSNDDNIIGYNIPKDQDYDDADDRERCPFCKRKFNSDVLKRHKPFCENKINSKNTMKFGKIKK